MSGDTSATQYARRVVLQVGELLARDARGELEEADVEWTSVADVYLWALDVLGDARKETRS